jgi:hypothetical protein
MAATTRAFIVSEALAVLILIAAGALGASPQSGTGEEWLLWTPEQRSTFIEGYVTGYLRGTRKACEAARDLYVADKSQRPGEDPSGPCLSRLESYSKHSDDLKLITSEPGLERHIFNESEMAHSSECTG